MVEGQRVERQRFHGPCLHTPSSPVIRGRQEGQAPQDRQRISDHDHCLSDIPLGLSPSGPAGHLPLDAGAHDRQGGPKVQTRAVVDDEAGLRLDRWFQRHFPELGHGALQKLLRTGQVRIDGKRAEGKDRVEPGQTIRLPPGVTAAPPPKPREIPTVSDRDAQEIRGLVIHKDDQVIVLNKPPGLAVQGGTGTERHVDGMLDALRFGYEERPRLVHRLDKDTSGLLLIARTGLAARRLGDLLPRPRDREALLGGRRRHAAAAGRGDRPALGQAAGCA